MVRQVSLLVLVGLLAYCSPSIFDDAPRTNFTVEGRFHCAIKGAWCVKYWLAERDTFRDDRIDSYGVICQHYGYQLPFTLKGWDRGDGMYDNFYELALFVLHNCNKHSHGLLTEIPFEPIPVTTLNFTKKFVRPIEITNQGTRVSREDYPI